MAADARESAGSARGEYHRRRPPVAGAAAARNHREVRQLDADVESRQHRPRCAAGREPGERIANPKPCTRPKPKASGSRSRASAGARLSSAASTMVAAIAASTGCCGSRTSPVAASPSVIECARVNVVTTRSEVERDRASPPRRRGAARRDCRQQQEQQEQQVVVADEDGARCPGPRNSVPCARRHSLRAQSTHG